MHQDLLSHVITFILGMFTGGMVSPIIFYSCLYASVTIPASPDKPRTRLATKKVMIVLAGLLLSVIVATFIYIIAYLIIGKIWGVP